MGEANAHQPHSHCLLQGFHVPLPVEGVRLNALTPGGHRLCGPKDINHAMHVQASYGTLNPRTGARAACRRSPSVKTPMGSGSGGGATTGAAVDGASTGASSDSASDMGLGVASQSFERETVDGVGVLNAQLLAIQLERTASPPTAPWLPAEVASGRLRQTVG